MRTKAPTSSGHREGADAPGSVFASDSQAALCTSVAVRRLATVPDPVRVYRALRASGYPWWLDSALPSEALGRFSFLGADPYAVARAHGRRLELEPRRAVRADLPALPMVAEGDPLALLRALLPAPPAPPPDLPVGSPALPFLGGAVGFFGYELGAFTEPVTFHGRDDLGLPDLALLLVDRLVAIDHVEGSAFAIGLGFDHEERHAAHAAAQASAEIAERIAHCRADGPVPPRLPGAPLVASDEVSSQRLAEPATGFDAPGHAKAVAAIQEQIVAGNVYQANYTQRIERPFAGDVLALHLGLRRINPAPFAALFELPEVAILSSSPERFLCVTPDGAVESRPIKGTRSRGRTAEEDAAQAFALAHSEKDRAENLMIVDLVRNDLGRVCETGSVAVPQLMVVEPYATVFQLVSSVTGRLDDGCDLTDLLRAAFPPGSMTGAPKIAAMRILDALEPVRRGVYAGALGYLDVRGGADLSVVIRTLLVQGGRAILHAGGGIVADSDAEAEYVECLDKARALLAALEQVDG